MFNYVGRFSHKGCSSPVIRMSMQTLGPSFAPLPGPRRASDADAESSPTARLSLRATLAHSSPRMLVAASPRTRRQANTDRDRGAARVLGRPAPHRLPPALSARPGRGGEQHASTPLPAEIR